MGIVQDALRDQRLACSRVWMCSSVIVEILQEMFDEKMRYKFFANA